MLTEQLRELEDDGIVNRVVYKELPPRVEYTLTEKGMALLPIVDSIQDWYVAMATLNVANKSMRIVR